MLFDENVTGAAAESLPFASIVIEDDHVVCVDGLKIISSDVADELAKLDDSERPEALIQMIEVGQHCLERASNSKDTEFVKRQLEKLTQTVETSVGEIPGRIEKKLMDKVGVDDGQVLKPLMDSTDLASKSIHQQLKQISDFVNQTLDVSKDTSSAGKVLRALRDLLDAERKGSVPDTFQEAIKSVTGKDGTLSESVKAVVADELKPILERLDKLFKELHQQEGAEAVVQETTKKGPRYEHKVVEDLQSWVKAVGAQLEHIGPDNKPGDVIVDVPESALCGVDLRLVIEARDRTDGKGRTAISKDMETKMAERSANAGIYLTKTSDGLAKGIGDWAEGESAYGPWVAATHDHLHTAVRFLITIKRLEALKRESPDVDGAAIESQIERIRTALKRITAINRKAGDVQSSAEGIKTEAGSLRDEIRDALNAVEDSLRQAKVPAA